MATTVNRSSATGILSTLEEPDYDLKVSALERLNDMVSEYWTEISESIQKIESLYEDESFPKRELAALIASKVYYQLGAYDDALEFALGAGKLFDVDGKSEYIQTIIAKCIDKYKDLRIKQYEELQQTKKTTIKIDPALEDIVERMFQRCFKDGKFKQALGIAIESRRLDKVKQSIMESGKVPTMLAYCLDVAMKLVLSRAFRRDLLLALVEMYRDSKHTDYFGVLHCLLFLNDPTTVASILKKLITGDETQLLTAYQIAFDLCDRATQAFLTTVSNLLKKELPSLITPDTDKPESKEQQKTETPQGTVAEDKKDEKKEKPEKSLFEQRLEKLLLILSQQVSIELHVDFLYRHNNTDLAILNNIKNSFERSSIYHSATITANAYMHAGTTVDAFLRDNLEWLVKATNWAKFSATASLGVIQKGQIKDSLQILSPYLPQPGQPRGSGNSIYCEGGALYALGIIHSNNGEAVRDYLLNYVKDDKTNEVVQHGACLGLGLAALATGDITLYEHLKEILYLDNAVSGESAAIAMGLVMLGSGGGWSPSNKKHFINEMLAYAHDTAHEKIIRGLAIGMALTQYGIEEEADELIDALTADKDPILRYGGMYAIGLAYAGTSNNAAIRKLLHVAVSDVSDDVRRAAVTALGFLLFKNPKQCPRLVSLLAESYNPHVRYGATMAVGISCAGTGLKEAIELLEPLARDPVDFVRQGAFMALAMTCIQISDAQEPKVAEIRKLLEKSWTGRHEIMSKMGAILAAGIIDAGGRNVTIALQKSGHNKMRGIVGMALFTQYWFWYPYLHFLSLTFEPTAIIGLNKDLKMPKFSFKSNAKPSLFAYPPPIKPPEKKQVTLAPTAQLSTSAKAKAKEQKKKQEKEAKDKMDTDSVPSTPVTPKPDEKKEETKEGEKKGEQKPEEKKEEKKPEPNFEILQNPARVTLAQLKYLSFDVDTKYVPLKTSNFDLGITMMRNLKPEENEVLIEPKSLKEEELEEPEPPQPFTFP